MLSRREILPGLAAFTAACGLQPEPVAPRASPPLREPPPPLDGAPRDAPTSSELAIGPLDTLDAIERRAFLDPEAFEPLVEADPGSWRARVDEPTESFADFVVSRPNPLLAPRGRLALLPWGAFPHEVVVEQDYVAIVRSPELSWLADFASRFFGVPCVALPARAWDPGDLPLRIRGGHDQFDAHAILGAASSLLPSDAHAMTVLVTRDLYYDEAQDFAFGYGTHRERLAVMSFARFDPQFAGHAREPDWMARIDERSLKLLAHEMAHTFGLRHCSWYACVLNGFAHLAEIDAAPLRLCPVCLRKLHHVVGLDLLARYESLRSFYADAGLLGIATWMDRRVQRLSSPS